MQKKMKLKIVVEDCNYLVNVYLNPSQPDTDYELNSFTGSSETDIVVDTTKPQYWDMHIQGSANKDYKLTLDDFVLSSGKTNEYGQAYDRGVF